MYKIYEVKSGETLESIAKELGILPDVLAQINGLNVNAVLVPNSSIIVPTDNLLFDKYTIKKGDTIYQVARMYNVNPTQLAKLNGLKEGEYIYPKQEIIVPRPGVGFYVTGEGDTLNGIVNTFKITPNDIIHMNDTVYLLEDQLIVYKK